MRELALRITGDNISAKAALAETESGITGVTRAAGGMGKAVDATGESVAAAGKKASVAGGLFSRAGGLMSSAITGAVAGIAGGLVLGAVDQLGSMAAKFMETGNAVADMADKLRVSTDDVQRFMFAIDQTGGSMPALVSSIGFLKKAVGAGKDGTVGALAELGFTLDQIRGMDTATLFTTVADAVGKIEDPMKQATVGAALMGRGFQANLAAMQEGFGNLGQQASDAGTIMSEKSVRAADQFGDSLSKLKDTGLALLGNVLGPFVPLLSNVIGILAAVLEPVGKLVSLGLQPLAFVLEHVSGWISGLVGYFSNIQQPITDTSSAIGVFWDWLANKVSPVMSPLIGLMSDIWDAFDAFARLVYAIDVKVVEAVAHMVGNVVTWFVSKLKPIFAPFKPILDGIGTLFVAMKDTAVGAASALYAGVKSWLVDKFVAIVDGAREKVQAVTGFFRDMYDKVVGHSYVPDMVDQVGEHFGRLDTLMRAPTEYVTGAVTTLFGSMWSDVSKGTDDWMNGLTRSVGTGVQNLIGKVMDGKLAMADFGSFATSILGNIGNMVTSGWVNMFVNAWRENGWRGEGTPPSGGTKYDPNTGGNPGSPDDNDPNRNQTEFATGGFVPASPGGRPFRLGDGGEGEWVVPQSKLANFVGGFGGGGASIDYERLGAAVARALSQSPINLDGRRVAEGLVPHMGYARQRWGLA